MTNRAIESQFLHKFSNGVFTETDARPIFDGNIVNLGVSIMPLATKDITEAYVWTQIKLITAWILEHKVHFNREDRFQIVIMLNASIRPTGRQIVKVSGKAADMQVLSNYSALPEIADDGIRIQRFNWHKDLF